MLAAMNLRKEVFALHMGSFSAEGIKPFLSVLTYGKSSRNTFPLQKGTSPEVKTVDKWDGEDGAPVSLFCLYNKTWF